jgi:hypothetical protein
MRVEPWGIVWHFMKVQKTEAAGRGRTIFRAESKLVLCATPPGGALAHSNTTHSRLRRSSEIRASS